MYPNPQDALPFPPSPNLEQYKKLAKELVKASQSANADAVLAWADAWINNLLRLQDPVVARQMPVRVDQWINALTDFARQRLSKTYSLTEAQFVIARAQGFESWPRLAKHIEALTSPDSAVSHFEAAAVAIVTGDARRLSQLLRDDPELIRARSSREHRATLLHYVSANGVESYRQRTPKNAVEIAGILLNAGAQIDAEADVYGGGCTTLGLVATSVHPHRAGVQNELMQLLLDHGAGIEPSQAEAIVNSCLANGQPEAAEFLADHGARLDLVGAAGIGRLDAVKSFFNDDGILKPSPPREQMVRALAYACGYGRKHVVEFLLDKDVDLSTGSNMGHTSLHWAVMGGHLEIVNLLLARKAPLEVKNAFGGTVLGQALWSVVNEPRPDHAAIIEGLIAAGAKVNPAWHTGIARVDEALQREMKV